MAKKNNIWQAVRGICILAVVLIHCPNAIAFGYHSSIFYVWLVIRQMLNFPVAVFIFLSGFFVNQDKCITAPKMFVSERAVKRLLIPYLFWSFLYSIPYIFSESFSCKTLVWHFVTGKSATPLYYIIVLIQLVILTPLLIRFLRMKNKLITTLLYLITPLYLLTMYYFGIILHRTLPLYATVFPAWLIFYLLGLQCRMSQEFAVKMKSLGKFSIIPIMVLLECGEALVLMVFGANISFVISQIRITSFLYALILICVFWQKAEAETLQNQNTFRHKFLIYLGNYSYGIYFVHYFFIKLSNKLLVIFSLSEIWIVSFAVTFFITLFGSVCVIQVFRWCTEKLNKQRIATYIGF